MSSILAEINSFQADLLSWFKVNQREMPWRASWGTFSDPYHVWLSEIMLQQTTVVTVIPYFLKFIEAWPDVYALATAEEEEILTAWAGLGYYARARNLHKCAKMVVAQFAGEFPNNEKALLALPGIGPYTASAITSIAFNKQSVAVDGNVERVVSRLFKIENPLPDSKVKIKKLTKKISNENDYPSAFTQALMELGALVCTPKTPKCTACPVKQQCAVAGLDNITEYPRRKKKSKSKPVRFAEAYWIYNENTQKFFVRKRPNKGLLANMMEVPTSTLEGVEDKNAMPKGLSREYMIELVRLDQQIVHVFTHFKLILNINILNSRHDVKDPFFKDGNWIGFDEVEYFPFPTLMKKVINTVKENPFLYLSN